MIPDLGTPYLPSWAGAPPHMAPLDLPIWTRYRPTAENRWTTIYYDAALGAGAAAPDSATAEQLHMWQRITRLRADAIAVGPAGWELIEVRHQAGPGAIGSLHTYLTLWKVDPPDTRPIRGIIVTNATTVDLIVSAEPLGITIDVA